MATKISKRAIENRGRTDGTFCHRCGERLDEAKARWLVLSCADGRFYATDAEADAFWARSHAALRAKITAALNPEPSP